MFGILLMVLSIVPGSVMNYLVMGFKPEIGAFVIFFIVGTQFSFSGFNLCEDPFHQFVSNGMLTLFSVEDHVLGLSP